MGICLSVLISCSSLNWLCINTSHPAWLKNIATSMSVCLVCLSVCQCVFKLHKIFCTCSPGLLLSPPLENIGIHYVLLGFVDDDMFPCNGPMVL